MLFVQIQELLIMNIFVLLLVKEEFLILLLKLKKINLMMVVYLVVYKMIVIKQSEKQFWILKMLLMVNYQMSYILKYQHKDYKKCKNYVIFIKINQL